MKGTNANGPGLAFSNGCGPSASNGPGDNPATIDWYSGAGNDAVLTHWWVLS